MFQIELIEKCIKNDRSAQLQLYKQYCEGMYYVAMRFLKNTEDAEDVVQEAFIKAFQKIHQYRAEVTFGAWLKKIVVNKCIDFLKMKRDYHLSLDEGYIQIAEDDNWEIEEGISMDEIKYAIECLPEKYKYVTMLYLMEGYDHNEISGILNISETASRTQLMRAKKKLKESLKSKQYGTRP